MKLESIQILLKNSIDYAGLFPPAQLDLETVIHNYAKYSHGEYSNFLGRLILSVSHLNEFSKIIDRLLFEERKTFPWKLSVLCNSKLEIDIEKIIKFNSANSDCAIIDSIELKVLTPEEVYSKMEIIPKFFVPYFEIPIFEELDKIEKLLKSISEVKARAKIRTGGISQELFPGTTKLLHFIYLCSSNNVAFKATAGLHHAIRAEYPLTYEQNSLCGLMHGFLNLFVAGVASQSLDFVETLEILEEISVNNFLFEEEKICWKNFTLSCEEILKAHDNFIISFGSCSFEEPINDLKTLGLI